MRRKYFICGTEMEEGTTSIKTGWGDYKLTINGVIAHICPRCGQAVYKSSEGGAFLCPSTRKH
jgi:YgiT-type zinc finger domain-containing protein